MRADIFMNVFHIISITKKLKWLFFLAGVFGDIGGIPHTNWLVWVFTFLALIEPGAIQGLYQIFGIFFINVSHKFNVPSKKNYKCKIDYILPFPEKWTVINGGVEKKLSHSWGILTQRYAYDFFILNDEGKSFAGDNKLLKNYYCYGKDIIAPADGIVVKLSNKHKDSRVDGKKVYCDAWDIRGNFILIKHSDNEYSAIAHIMQNSFTVNVGDKVKQGEVIAQCGNSGNTSEPHIHFQLQTGKSFFLSAGLPIAFTNINANAKNNYELADKRPVANNLQTTIDNKFYIGRGLEVENVL